MKFFCLLKGPRYNYNRASLYRNCSYQQMMQSHFNNAIIREDVSILMTNGAWSFNQRNTMFIIRVGRKCKSAETKRYNDWGYNGINKGVNNLGLVLVHIDLLKSH